MMIVIVMVALRITREEKYVMLRAWFVITRVVSSSKNILV